MAHETFIESALRIAMKSYGKQFEDESAAEKDLLKTLDLGSACLLKILNKLEMFGRAISQDEVEEVTHALMKEANGYVSEWIKSREESHGECPRSVYIWASDEMDRIVGRRFRGGSVRRDWRGMLGLSIYSFGPPEKGTTARKEYDNWMKRRGKAKVKSDGVK